VCYKSPSIEDYELEQLFCSIKEASRNQVLIMGDFNYPDIDWDTLSHNHSSSDFIDLILDSYLIQHVNEPTRENNILDLVFTSESSMVENLEIKEHLSTSDHNIICWDLICKTDISQTSVIKYNYSTADYVKINKHLNDIDWETSLKDLDPESMWETFCDLVNEVIIKLVPKMRSKSKGVPVWMTRDVKKTQKT
jgi:hypothetical protein